MKALYSMFADYASKSDTGALNILGIFTGINATAFPTAYPQFYLVVRLVISNVERKEPQAFGLEWIDEQGTIISSVNIVSDLIKDNPLTDEADLIVKLVMLMFPHPGKFTAIVSNGTKELCRQSLTVARVVQPEVPQ